MPAPKIRTEAQRAAVLAEIATRYRAGETQAAIGAALGLSQQGISYYLARLHQEWRTRADADIDAAKAHELARLDWLEAEAAAEYERSKAATHRRVVSTSGDSATTTETTEGRTGDPRFLSIIDDCVDKRCKIFGLYAPVRQELSGTLSSPPIREVVVTLKHEPVGSD